jgi:hypothetical protein
MPSQKCAAGYDSLFCAVGASRGDQSHPGADGCRQRSHDAKPTPSLPSHPEHSHIVGHFPHPGATEEAAGDDVVMVCGELGILRSGVGTRQPWGQPLLEVLLHSPYRVSGLLLCDGCVLSKPSQNTPANFVVVGSRWYKM